MRMELLIKIKKIKLNKMKKDSKQRLFEVMNRLDKSIAKIPKLNEEYEFPNVQEEYRQFEKYFVGWKSRVEDFGEGHVITSYVFNIPKAEYNDSIHQTMFNEFDDNSHGVEGNAGGWVTKTRVHDPIDMGDVIEITIAEEKLLDV